MRSDDEAELCKAFGKHIAAIRKEKHWSQEKLALESGLARSYIGDLERGLRNVALINLFRLADTLGVQVTLLMNFRDKHDQTDNTKASRREEA